MMTRYEFLRSLVGLGLGAAALAACGTDTDPGRDDPGNDAGADPTPDAGNGTTPTDAGNPSNTDASTGPGDAPPVDTLCPGMAITIGSNHGHTLTIPDADLASTTTKVYQMGGPSDHPHSVTITPQQFAILRTDGYLSVQSSTDDGHPHSVIIRCA
jgi:hypothetical protein